MLTRAVDDDQHLEVGGPGLGGLLPHPLGRSRIAVASSTISPRSSHQRRSPAPRTTNQATAASSTAAASTTSQAGARGGGRRIIAVPSPDGAAR